jgi:NAD(P) transhydrogenase
MGKNSFDVIVLGSGPGGIETACAASDFGLDVLLIGDEAPGGGSGLWGTVPSKSLRYSALRAEREKKSAQWAFTWMKKAVQAHVSANTDQLKKRPLTSVPGKGKLLGPNKIGVGKKEYEGKKIVIATGGKPSSFPDWNDDLLLNSDKILRLKNPPLNLLIVGAGVIGCEYASILRTLGCRVTVVDRRRELLRCLDQSLVDCITETFKQKGIKVVLGAELTSPPRRTGSKKKITLGINGRALGFDGVLICMGRIPQTAGLGLESVGLATDERGYLKVNSETQATDLPWLYAVGDVVGAPGLAAAAQCQGLRAAAAMAGRPLPKSKLPLPTGIYTIPELAGVGATEIELKEKKVPYLSFVEPYGNLAKPAFREAAPGFLKILACPQSGQILGAHGAGWEASEVVNLASLAMGSSIALPDMAAAVWNYPTSAEAFRLAARYWLTQK